MNLFRFLLLTPQGTIIDEDILSLVLPTADGSIGILAGREHTILEVEEGVLHFKNAAGEERRYFVGDGVAEVQAGVVSLVTGEAYLEDAAEESRRAREESILAEKRRQEKSAVDYKLTKVALSRAFEILKRKDKE